MSATTHRRTTSEVVLAIKAAIVALQWQPPVGPPVPAFDRVELFDSENLVEAFRFLLVTEQKVCVVLPLQEAFETKMEGLKFMWLRKLPVMVLCSDVTLGDRPASLWGTQAGAPVPSPGAEGLAEIVLPAIAGQILANEAGLSGVVCHPMNKTVLTVKDTQSELPSRVTVGIEFECRGGWLESRLVKGPVL